MPPACSSTPAAPSFRCIPERPTFDDAKRALATISELIKDFPFIERHDRSVAISAILTAPVRRSLPGAPMHGVTAPTAGTGKGKLVDIACVIATGFRSSPVNLGRDEVELGKSLAAKLMAGRRLHRYRQLHTPDQRRSALLHADLGAREPAHPRPQQSAIDLFRVLRRGQRK